MPLDTIDSLVGRVQKRTGMLPDYFLIREWLTTAYQDLVSRIAWTFRRKQGQFVFCAPITTGTVTINRGENIAAFSSGIVTPAIIGRQLRAGGNEYPICTLTGYIDSTHATIDSNWSAVSVSAVGYEIYQAYVTMPEDFDSFLTIVDLQRGYQLDFWNHTADELDRVDPRRAFAGNTAYWMVLKDYSSDRRGYVTPAIQVSGGGNVPVSGGAYNGPADATFSIQMATDDTYIWKKDSGAFSSPVTVDPDGNPQPLQDGVEIVFPPTGGESENTFTFRAIAASSPGSPRYEPWPHIKVDVTLPYMYLSKMPDLTDAGTVLPRYVRADVLVELALAQWAAWPGSASQPNPAYNAGLRLAAYHTGRAEDRILDMEREDQARETTDVSYDSWLDLPVYDSAFLAGHDIGYELNVLDS